LIRRRTPSTGIGADKDAKAKDPSAKTPDGKVADEHPDSTGSGVVIDEKATSSPNLHVVSSTDRWVVTFADWQQIGRHHGVIPAGE